MSINYIPNDPLAVDDVPMRSHTPRPDRPSNGAGFTYLNGAPEGRYPVASPEFLFWQCSEAALAAVEAFEILDGGLSRWAGNKRRLEIRQNAGNDLNAYYDRSSLSFFEFTTGSKTTSSGASTDVVAHEAGHALLDAIRPDLWNSFLPEVNAFHEAFGDCMALITALEDPRSRRRLIETSSAMWSENFLEATAEDLSDGVRRAAGASHPASAPRHAFNFFEWKLPSTLPADGPPSRLTSEIHSFGRIFSGCFYDLIGILWNSQPSWSDTALRTAARTAGRLVIAGARSAPETPRFFQSVGRAMVLADQQLNGGANRQSIHDAFDYHRIALGTSAMLAPTAALAGPAPRRSAARSALSASTRKDLLRRIGAARGATLKVRPVEVAGRRFTEATHERAIPLGGIDKRLRGVWARAAERTLIGSTEKSAAVLGGLPEPNVTADEVTTFVETLCEHGNIAFGGKRKRAAGGGPARAIAGRPAPMPTHAIRSRGGKKVLVRVRYVCG